MEHPLAINARFSGEVKASPYLFLTGGFVLIMGMAAGVSTNSMAEGGRIIGVAAEAVTAIGGYEAFVSGALRALLFNCAILSILIAARFLRILLVPCYILAAFKGFILGYALNQLILEYGILGLLYALALVLLPQLFLLSGFSICLMRCSGKCASENKGNHSASSILRDALPACLGAALEAVFTQLIFLMLASYL